MKTENRLQQECYMWFHNSYPKFRGLYFEIHNNAFSARSGMLHKSIGRIPGVADNCLLLPDCKGPVFFEFKTEKGKQSIEQAKWKYNINRQGYQYYIIRDTNNFKLTIKCLLESE